MIKRIGKNSVVEMDGDLFNLKIKKPFWNGIIGLLITLVFLIVFFYQFKDSSENNNTPVFLFVFFMVTIISTFYNITLKDIYRMDWLGNKLSRKKFIFGFLFKSFEINWEKNSAYLYEVEFDSYKRISAVWLLVINKDKNVKRRLIKFHDMETFEAFRGLVHEKFSSIRIGEWHDKA